MLELIIATRNNNKLREIKTLLKGLPVEVLGLDDLSKKIPQVKEDRKTFAGNAAKKALAISGIYKDALVLADDSGLCVDYLKGSPGVNSARYAGAAQIDKNNIAKLLKNMARAKKRKAFFICTVAIAMENKILAACEGKVFGNIIRNALGESGFGYDPVFVPAGYKKTFAQMSASFKNKISHRARAFRKARRLIGKYLRIYL
ncbi:MAG: RdgB/HAM1 family non-canonical purine NTP pyrophosphatase [Candidatus Omnitrophota bacterium]